MHPTKKAVVALTLTTVAGFGVSCKDNSTPPLPPPPIRTVATLAGSVLGGTDGQGTGAQFNNPAGIAIDRNGGLYVADRGNNEVRYVTPAGLVTTYAGGSDGAASGSDAAPDMSLKTVQFTALNAVALDVAGNLYTAEANRLRKITASGTITTLAGGTTGFKDGQGTDASFAAITGIAVDVNGNVYAADSTNNAIRKITPTGAVTTLVGSGGAGYADGPAASAKFNLPSGVAVDSSFNVFVADRGNNSLRKINYAGTVTTLAGAMPGNAGFKDGPAAMALFDKPQAIVLDDSGNLYVAEGSNRIRKLAADGTVSTLAGTGDPGYVDGDSTKAKFFMPMGLAIKPGGRGLLVSEQLNNRIRLIDL